MTPREELLEMLRYKRPARTKGETKFINRFLLTLPGAVLDAFGNVIVRVGEGSPILWSSHTDTVHSHSGKQLVHVDHQDFAEAPFSDCLGADCTTGVWLMMHMIRAGKPGLYIFHRDEECGGRGSDYIAKDTPELLAGIKYAIAFDRKGTTSIVTHQFGQRCCSEAFVKSLNEALGGAFKSDDTGTFTDTANYTELVPECANISVGYYKQHTSLECQDLEFAELLLDALLEADFSGLVCERDPPVVDYDWNDKWWERYGTFSGSSKYDFNDNETPPFGTDYGAAAVDHLDQLRSLVMEHPEVAASLLDQYGVRPDDILSQVYAHH